MDGPINQSFNEADASRKFVVPLIQAAGWDNDHYSIAKLPQSIQRQIQNHRRSRDPAATGLRRLLSGQVNLGEN